MQGGGQKYRRLCKDDQLVIVGALIFSMKQSYLLIFSEDKGQRFEESLESLLLLLLSHFSRVRLCVTP